MINMMCMLLGGKLIAAVVAVHGGLLIDLPLPELDRPRLHIRLRLRRHASVVVLGDGRRHLDLARVTVRHGVHLLLLSPRSDQAVVLRPQTPHVTLLLVVRPLSHGSQPHLLLLFGPKQVTVVMGFLYPLGGSAKVLGNIDVEVAS